MPFRGFGERYGMLSGCRPGLWWSGPGLFVGPRDRSAGVGPAFGRRVGATERDRVSPGMRDQSNSEADAEQWEIPFKGRAGQWPRRQGLGLGYFGAPGARPGWWGQQWPFPGAGQQGFRNVAEHPEVRRLDRKLKSLEEQLKGVREELSEFISASDEADTVEEENRMRISPFIWI